MSTCRTVNQGKYRVVKQFEGTLLYSVYYQYKTGHELVCAFKTRNLARMYVKYMNSILDEINE